MRNYESNADNLGGVANTPGESKNMKSSLFLFSLSALSAAVIFAASIKDLPPQVRHKILFEHGLTPRMRIRFGAVSKSASEFGEKLLGSVTALSRFSIRIEKD